MYREVRETTAARAMAKMFSEMAGQYHTRYSDIQIIKYEVITAEQIKRQKNLNMIHSEHNEVKFPHPFAKSTIKRNAKLNRFAKKVEKAEI
jgi:ribosomal protein L20A (L18A)